MTSLPISFFQSTKIIFARLITCHNKTKSTYTRNSNWTREHGTSFLILFSAAMHGVWFRKVWWNWTFDRSMVWDLGRMEQHVLSTGLALCLSARVSGVSADIYIFFFVLFCFCFCLWCCACRVMGQVQCVVRFLEASQGSTWPCTVVVPYFPSVRLNDIYRSAIVLSHNVLLIEAWLLIPS